LGRYLDDVSKVVRHYKERKLTSKQDEIRLVLLASRELQSIEVRVGNSDILSLTSSVGTHGDITISSSGKSGVDASAESSFAFFTVAAAAIGDVEWHNNTVALL
jgi:hypothetical protein